MAVAGIGEIVADSIVEFFKTAREVHRVDNLLKHVKVESQKSKVKSGKLSGTTWVLTGTLESLGREQAKEKIRAFGGDVSETVSKNTTYVVAGENPGSKYDKAKKLGIEILDEKEFLKKLKD